MVDEALADVEQVFAREGTAAGLEAVGRRLAERRQWHELFDLRLMQARHRLGLPILSAAALDDLPSQQRDPLEAQYLEACREIGLALLAERRWRDAWIYLRPLGEPQLVAAALAEVEPTGDEVGELVEVALHEGVDPVRGYGWVLDHYGVCNAISVFEAEVRARSRGVQEQAAALLVRRVHADLLERVRADIERREGTAPAEASLTDLIAPRPELFAGQNYHLDTTHLAATVRFARLVEEPAALRLALELAEYGRRLDAQYQFPGDEPFADSYPAHRLFFAAQLGTDVEQALAHFRTKAQALLAEEHGSLPVEAYVALLDRVGRTAEAAAAAAELLPPGARTTGLAPTLWELCRKSGDYGPLIAVSRARGELLGLAAALAAQDRETQRPAGAASAR
jgi:hypothetical protein